jgi:hypothetical protein
LHSNNPDSDYFGIFGVIKPKPPDQTMSIQSGQPTKLFEPIGHNKKPESNLM